jgi:hypothetical protein
MPSTEQTKKKPAIHTTKRAKKVAKVTFITKARRFFPNFYTTITRRINGLSVRRPHRSFQRTRRRDYVRPLRLPGYWAFTNSVRKILMQNKKLFLGLAAVYGILTVLFVGLASQDIYTELSDMLRSTSGEVLAGNLGELGKAGLLLTTALSGTLSGAPTDLQRVYGVIFALLIWLTTVWLLRAIMAGHRPKLRDGLYNASAPFLSTFLVGLILAIQLLPIALAAVAFGAATSSGLLEGGVEAMVFWVSAGLLSTLSLYWASSTLIAMVIVTLPGMYPMQAIRTAGDLVIGRRVRILLRLVWLLLTALLLWIVVMIPIILLDTWIKGLWPAIDWVPVVPIALLVVGSITVVWSSSYTYLLYRKVVDDDAAPA